MCVCLHVHVTFHVISWLYLRLVEGGVIFLYHFTHQFLLLPINLSTHPNFIYLHFSIYLQIHPFLTLKTQITEKAYSLFDHDLRRPFGEEPEAADPEGDHRGHGLPRRVECVHLDELLLRVVIANRLVVLAQLAHETQQSALCLVADLLREFAGHFGGNDLRRVVGVDADPEDQ